MLNEPAFTPKYLWNIAFGKYELTVKCCVFRKYDPLFLDLNVVYSEMMTPYLFATNKESHFPNTPHLNMSSYFPKALHYGTTSRPPESWQKLGDKCLPS